MFLFFTGSHEAFSDVDSLLACAGSECVFCQEKELANKNHLYRRHLRDAIHFQKTTKVSTKAELQRDVCM